MGGPKTKMRLLPNRMSPTHTPTHVHTRPRKLNRRLKPFISPHNIYISTSERSVVDGGVAEDAARGGPAALRPAGVRGLVRAATGGGEIVMDGERKGVWVCGWVWVCT